MTVRVLIVDDHPVVRSGLHALLAADAGLCVVGEAGSGEEALALLPRLRPDVVLTDLRLGSGIDGVETTRRIRHDAADTPAVVILTTYDDDTDIVRAVEAGAAGYLLKDALPQVIVSAVQDAARGRTVLAPGVAAGLVRALAQTRPLLSPREHEVITLVAEGLSNREVAKRLFISQATVKTHLVHIFDKLEVANRTAAVAQARRLGLVV